MNRASMIKMARVSWKVRTAVRMRVLAASIVIVKMEIVCDEDKVQWAIRRYATGRQDCDGRVMRNWRRMLTSMVEMWKKPSSTSDKQ